MDPQPKPEYPTGQQIEDSFKAYKENGATGILEYLKEQRRKREAEDPPRH
jgi:hypothetical protein